MLYTNAIICFYGYLIWPLFCLLLPHIANLIGAEDLTHLLLTSSHLLFSVSCSAVLYKIAREVTKWQCTLYDCFHTALNEALKKEDERLKIAIGEVMTRAGEKL